MFTIERSVSDMTVRVSAPDAEGAYRLARAMQNEDEAQRMKIFKPSEEVPMHTLGGIPQDAEIHESANCHWTAERFIADCEKRQVKISSHELAKVILLARAGARSQERNNCIKLFATYGNQILAKNPHKQVAAQVLEQIGDSIRDGALVE